MNDAIDPVVEADLDAYVDDQLDAGRRIEIARYLSHHPEQAARVMSDLQARDELRLALTGMHSKGSPETSEAARRLERGLMRNRLLGNLQRVAAVAVLVGIGWLAHAGFGPLTISEVVASTPPPAYVADAVMAHKTSLVRAGMKSQSEVNSYDPAEIRAATAITMPQLLDRWIVNDVQLFPSAFGPSVEMEIRSDEMKRLSLFAVRPGSFDVVKPKALRIDDSTAAYFQIGDVAYALVSDASPADLEIVASQLAKTLY
ncbi:anti-sigma factor family protein [Phyllobacterium bourgognense]|uniref:Anti-sigma factor RsiW n=1 Tax=Phyllobacterium bourgognense TaxID=314236 RepID=A0A368YPT5_9HYPH|nr:anti-sigma factor [Phyllobacterium bourgognense]RCW82241.1 anti-sigma factor RsiW [Phyllobacterium bourgognense]